MTSVGSYMERRERWNAVGWPVEVRESILQVVQRRVWRGIECSCDRAVYWSRLAADGGGARCGIGGDFAGGGIGGGAGGDSDVVVERDRCLAGYCGILGIGIFHWHSV